MKKSVITFAVIVIASLVASAEYKASNSSKVVYHVEGENAYHTSAESAKAHAIIMASDSAKIYMQLESGCKKSHMHKCAMCEIAEGLNK